jgi:hypothetical protein
MENGEVCSGDCRLVPPIIFEQGDTCNVDGEMGPIEPNSSFYNGILLVSKGVTKWNPRQLYALQQIKKGLVCAMGEKAYVIHSGGRFGTYEWYHKLVEICTMIGLPRPTEKEAFGIEYGYPEYSKQFDTPTKIAEFSDQEFGPQITILP